MAKRERHAMARSIRLLGWLLGLRPIPAERPSRERTIDAWQWTQRKYRFRSLGLLFLDAVLFGGLCCFTLWLRTGHYFIPFSGLEDESGIKSVVSQAMTSPQAGYWSAWWSAFNPAGEEQLTLIDYLIHPIPVDQVPLMLVIIGLVLGSLTAVPILVSMLYRLPFSLVFILLIGFVAMLPWLAITMTACCFLARWRPLRFSFHYATALVALLPVVAYYALATRKAAAFQVLPQIEIAKLYVPWVLAIVAACVVMGIVLAIAKLVNYRPGAIAPPLAVMFVLPVVLFEARAGRDELYYRLVESTYGPGSKIHFMDDLELPKAIKEAARDLLTRNKDSAATSESCFAMVAHGWQDRLETSLVDQQDQAVAACESFRRRFPLSRYVPNVLYIKARALDMRIDQESFRRAFVLKYYSDFPCQSSKSAWKDLYECRSSPLSRIAALRMAVLAVRAGHIGQSGGDDQRSALDLLKEIIDHSPQQEDPFLASAPNTGWWSLMAKREASNTLGPFAGMVAQEAARLHYLLYRNLDSTLDNGLALRRLLCLVPRHPLYYKNLIILRADIEAGRLVTPLKDNIDVLVAANELLTSLKIDGLRKCVERLVNDP